MEQQKNSFKLGVFQNMKLTMKGKCVILGKIKNISENMLDCFLVIDSSVNYYYIDFSCIQKLIEEALNSDDSNVFSRLVKGFITLFRKQRLNMSEISISQKRMVYILLYFSIIFENLKVNSIFLDILFLKKKGKHLFKAFNKMSSIFEKNNLDDWKTQISFQLKDMHSYITSTELLSRQYKAAYFKLISTLKQYLSNHQEMNLRYFADMQKILTYRAGIIISLSDVVHFPTTRLMRTEEELMFTMLRIIQTSFYVEYAEDQIKCKKSVLLNLEESAINFNNFLNSIFTSLHELAKEKRHVLFRTNAKLYKIQSLFILSHCGLIWNQTIGSMLEDISIFEDLDFNDEHVAEVIYNRFNEFLEVLYIKLKNLPYIIKQFLQAIWAICEKKFPIIEEVGDEQLQKLKKKLHPILNLIFLLFFASPNYVGFLKNNSPIEIKPIVVLLCAKLLTNCVYNKKPNKSDNLTTQRITEKAEKIYKEITEIILNTILQMEVLEENEEEKIEDKKEGSVKESDRMDIKLSLSLAYHDYTMIGERFRSQNIPIIYEDISTNQDKSIMASIIESFGTVREEPKIGEDSLDPHIYKDPQGEHFGYEREIYLAMRINSLKNKQEQRDFYFKETSKSIDEGVRSKENEVTKQRNKSETQIAYDKQLVKNILQWTKRI